MNNKKNNNTSQRGELLVNQYYLKELTPLSKSYSEGDCGEEVTKIKEWLMLWQLNENYVDIIMDLKPDIFDENTKNLTKEIQNFMNIPATGIVDALTWQHLVSPLKKAFDLNYYNATTLKEKMVYFATRHLQFRSAELQEDNLGPWIRAYMGYEGKHAYWCQALACIILDQTFSSIGKKFDEYYPQTYACETMRQFAMKNGLLITVQDLLDKKYIPQPGDQVVYLEGVDKIAHHTEIVYEVLNSEKGNMRTIGGNTNFSGSRNGVGTFIVDRNFLTDELEVVRTIELEDIK